MGADRDAPWVVAIGGNALADPHDPRALARQGEAAAALAPALAEVIAAATRLVIVHGNGPQVGARLLQSEAAAAQVPPSPLHVCVAETQGQMGHHLSLALTNELHRRRQTVPVVTLVTHVLVDPQDPEFANPDKPVGPIYGEDEAHRLAAERGWHVHPVSGGGWRRVVPSPRPLTVIEVPAILRLVEEGCCVIAGGGGGIPLAHLEPADGRARTGGLLGIDAVVDKDYAAERIATAIGASRLVILTDVPGAAQDFATPSPRFLDRMTIAEAREHLQRGEFAPGSMAPKVEACIEFIEAGGRDAVIAATAGASSALQGRSGTRITAG